jgi:hypothetical protein
MTAVAETAPVPVTTSRCARHCHGDGLFHSRPNPLETRSRLTGRRDRHLSTWRSDGKLALAIILMVGLAACGTSQPDVPGSSGPGSSPPVGSGVLPGSTMPLSAVPSAASSPPIAPEPRPSRSRSAAPAAALPVGKIAVVVTNDLRVRSKPRVAADSTLKTPLLNKGRAVYVVAGPVHASGFSWYEVAPVQPFGEFDLPFGWVAAAGKDGEPWLAAGGFRCPAKPTDVAGFLDVPPLAGLACFGRHDLAIAGRLARPELICALDTGWTIQPEWFQSPCTEFYLFDLDTTDAWVDVVLNPGIDVSDLEPGSDPADWQDVLVTGHFDVRAAANCRGVVTEPGTVIALSPDEIVLACRATFVVTDIETSGYLP